ncbi:carboxylating nicotinate-nucleotide diphosphorylase [Thermovibrio sp.]
MSPIKARELILNFLEEDLGITGDWSSLPLRGKRLKGELIAKEEFILCGTPFFEEVIRTLDEKARFNWKFKEGKVVKRGVICEIEADGNALLSAERTALNLLQRLSGIATRTGEFVEVLRGSPVKLLDTRKTTPGLRTFEKYATKVGGALNHRMGLFDAVMIKDNHIKAYGGVKKAVLKVKKEIPITMKVEVEVESEEELKEVLEVIELVDIVMLDNWKLNKVKGAVKELKERKPSLKVEVSGGVDKESLKFIKELPVDFVSTSKVITTAKWVDISLEVKG